MTTALAHRGPDDQGLYVDDTAVLGHRRLTIIDLSTAGRQPLSNEDQSLWITYNGETYNYRELRRDLEGRGHRFHTHTDTEVVLHLYEQYGVECVHYLRGMFAFAIWDRRRQRLFAARDRFGQKPLFYTRIGNRLLFASEVKGLLAHPDVSAEPEPAAIDYYLSLRFVPPPLTMLRGIHKLAAGHSLVWNDGHLTVNRYWGLAFTDAPHRSDGDWIDELGERVQSAVHLHTVSDVPVGAFLSGGIDSSVVVASMARYADESVQTFAIGSDEATFDETPHARHVADYFGTHHRERFVSAGRLDDIPTLVACLDEPSDPISACIFEVARLASEHVKVVLSGDGGDEIFAGFDRYAAFEWVGWYARLPRWIRESVVAPGLRRLPESFGYKSLTQRARWLNDLAGSDGGQRYARMTSFFRFGPDERLWAYGPELRQQLSSQASEEAISRPFEEADTADVLHRMLHADVVTRLPEHTLMLADRLSMAHGLETRAPLLDHELAEFCAAMPAHLKVRRGITKYAMRRAAEPWLPRSIVRRKKQGFMFPVAFWLNDETLPQIRRDLIEGRIVQDGWITREAVDRLTGEHLKQRVDHHVRIWMLLNLEAWLELFVTGESHVRRPTTADADGARLL
jgi:asparagine synthase (glutamine-hydrolysing)